MSGSRKCSLFSSVYRKFDILNSVLYHSPIFRIMSIIFFLRIVTLSSVLPLIET